MHAGSRTARPLAARLAARRPDHRGRGGRSLHLPAVPGFSPLANQEEVLILCGPCGTVLGEQLAQVDNPDPFASPVVAVPGVPDPGAGDLDRPARPAAHPAGPVRVPAPVPGSGGRDRGAGLAERPVARSSPGLVAAVTVTLAGWRLAVPGLVRAVRRRSGRATGGGGGSTGGAGRR